MALRTCGSDGFATIGAENKATLKRTHAERWLNKNRARLTHAEIAVVQEAIPFFTFITDCLLK